MIQEIDLLHGNNGGRDAYTKDAMLLRFLMITALTVAVLLFEGRAFAPPPTVCPSCMIVWCESVQIAPKSGRIFFAEVDEGKEYSVSVEADAVITLDIDGGGNISNPDCVDGHEGGIECGYEATASGDVKYSASTASTEASITICHRVAK